MLPYTHTHTHTVCFDVCTNVLVLLISLSHTLCVLSFPDRNGGLPRGSHRSLLQVSNTYSDVPVDWQLWYSWRWGWRVWTQQGFFLSHVLLIVFLIVHNSSKTIILILLVWFLLNVPLCGLVVWIFQNPCCCSHCWGGLRESQSLELRQVSG